MDWLNNTFTLLAASQLALLGLFFLYHYGKDKLGLLLVFFCLCLMAYLVSRSTLIDSGAVSYIARRLANITPALLWVIAFKLFTDGRRIHPAVWVLVVVYLVARAPLSIYTPTDEFRQAWRWGVYVMPQVVMLGFCLHAIHLAFTGISSDLVEQRRRVRVTFVISMGILLAILTANGFLRYAAPVFEFVRIDYPGMVPGVFFSGYVLFGALAFNVINFQLRSGAADLIISADDDPGLHTAATPKPQVEVDPAVVEAIGNIMEQERLYARMGLTIGDLANALSMQEYRLRRVINQQMHYRNFNQFLNQYRIEEASLRIRDTDTPISSIALDVGYASLSSFNKAFKDAHGVTPTEYRNRNLTLLDSLNIEGSA
ncbi:MAG: helix-turn-helix transcriptional regulator [Pseudohongiellaceae bacterium]